MADKKEYERAVDAFEVADAAYAKLQEYVESGEFLREILNRSMGNYETAQTHWNQVWEKLKALKDERNVKLKSAKDALRQAVVLGPTQERGPEGTATIIRYGDFTVSSVTHRTFEPESLIKLCERFGVLQELMGLQYLDKDGVEKFAFKQEWKVNYERVMEWLKARDLQTVINGAYDEQEKTPSVRGPKEIAFLGEKKGD